MLKIVSTVAAILLALPASAATLFATDTDSNSLLTIDTTTAAVTVVGALGTNVEFEGLAYDGNSDTLYMVGGRGNNALYRVDPLTGAATLIGSHGLSDMFGLGYDTTNDVLYGTRRVDGTGLYALNTTTGAATEVTPAISVRGLDGLDYDPVRDRLLGISVGAGDVYAVDRTTGALSLLAATSGFVNNAGAAYDPGSNTLWVADVNGNIFTFDLDTGVRSTFASDLGYRFSGLTFGARGETPVIPVPPGLPLLASALVLVGLVLRRRSVA